MRHLLHKGIHKIWEIKRVVVQRHVSEWETHFFDVMHLLGVGKGRLHRDRQTDRQRHRDRQRPTETDTERQRQRETKTDRQTDRDRETETQRQTEWGETDKKRARKR